MAANPKTLRVVDAHSAGPDTRVLELECVEGGAFNVVGGKYIIVHTGLMLADKAIKRAYSLMPVPERPGRAAIAVKRLPGPGSQAMHAIPLGATLGFSGPWGKLVPEAGLAARTLLVATDTGITSALGIVEQYPRARGVSALSVLWLREPTETFLDVASVRRRIEHAGAEWCLPRPCSNRRADANRRGLGAGGGASSALRGQPRHRHRGRGHRPSAAGLAARSFASAAGRAHRVLLQQSREEERLNGLGARVPDCGAPA